MSVSRMETPTGKLVALVREYANWYGMELIEASKAMRKVLLVYAKSRREIDKALVNPLWPPVSRR